MQSELIPNIATGFCSGLAQTCGFCGAVSGAIMAISLFYGRSSPGEKTKTNYTMVQKLINTFENKFGSTNCKQLIGCDLGSIEGRNVFQADDLIEQCKNYTEEATRLAMSIIKEQF